MNSIQKSNPVDEESLDVSSPDKSLISKTKPRVMKT